LKHVVHGYYFGPRRTTVCYVQILHNVLARFILILASDCETGKLHSRRIPQIREDS
jgi:hypothetical protein